METNEKILITVETSIEAPVEKVWNFWTKPEHITHWNFASDDWHCPWVKNDVREGGKFVWRMEAKDGSFGFDYNGKYIKVIPNKRIEKIIEDGRIVTIEFKEDGNKTHVTEVFEAETHNPVEMQKTGWQAILNNFKKYTEESETMEKMHFEIVIAAKPEKVYNYYAGR